jgi:hypothetical protein
MHVPQSLLKLLKLQEIKRSVRPTKERATTFGARSSVDKSKQHVPEATLQQTRDDVNRLF